MRTRRGLGLAVVVVSLALAGCSGDAAEQEDSGRPPAGQTSPETGAVVGSVLDAEALPISRATVILLPSSGTGDPIGQAATDESGGFHIDLVEPGTYRAAATAPTYRSQSLFIDVKSDHTTTVGFTLAKAESRVPYHYTLPQAGQLSCAAAAVVAPTGGACPQDDHENRMFFPIPAGFAYIVAEAMWDAGSEHLVQYYSEEDPANNTRNHTLIEAWGAPGLRAELTPAMVTAPPPDSLIGLTDYGPVPEGPFLLNVTTFYAGQLSDEFDDVANQVCQNAYGRCAGVGATLSLRYENFVTIFMHRAPADPGSFTALS
jgi:hypothetical protein